MEGSAAAGYVIDGLSTVIAVEYMDHGFEKKYSGAARIMVFAGGCAAYYGVMPCLTDMRSLKGLWGSVTGRPPPR